MNERTKLSIDIAAKISVQPEFSNVESPLILDIVRATMAEMADPRGYRHSKQTRDAILRVGMQPAA